MLKIKKKGKHKYSLKHGDVVLSIEVMKDRPFGSTKLLTHNVHTYVLVNMAWISGGLPVDQIRRYDCCSYAIRPLDDGTYQHCKIVWKTLSGRKLMVPDTKTIDMVKAAIRGCLGGYMHQLIQYEIGRCEHKATFIPGELIQLCNEVIDACK